MKKKVLAIIMIIAVVFCFSACGSSDEGGTNADMNDVLYHAFESNPFITLDPRVEVSNGISILHNVYETLTHYNDKTGEVEPLLATSWETPDDGLTWVFQLRDDVTFHDGTPMTAQNVVNSINATVEMGMGAAYIWDALDYLEATGDYEVTFHLTYAAPIDIICTAAYAAYIVSDAALENDTEWFNAGNEGGTGPYTIAQATADTVVLKAYDGYYGGWTDKQYKNVIVKQVGESSARRQLLETGEAQLAAELASTDVKALSEETDIVTVQKFDTYTNTLLFLNHESEPCSNVYFRQALAYAFPYDETINDIIEGNAMKSSGLVTPGLWGHDDAIGCYGTDLEKAKECLEKSGLDYEGMKISMTYATGIGEYDSFAQLFQVNLKSLGIELQLNPMEWDSQWAQAQNTKPEDRQDIFLMQWWPDYPDPVSWFSSLIHSEDSIVYNLGYINDAELDAKIDEAIENTSSDREKAENLYKEVQQSIYDNADILPIYDMVKVYITSNAIEGVYENPAYPSSVSYYDITKK